MRILTQKIKNDRMLINPILVGQIKKFKQYIILDGINRLEALKSLNIKYVVAQVVDYFNEEQINLFSNHHYFPIEDKNIIGKIRNTNSVDWNLINKKQANQLIEKGEIIGYIRIKNRFWSLGRHTSLKQSVDLLNKIVNVYLGQVKFYRLSEIIESLSNYPMEIAFRRFRKKETAELSCKRIMLNSGITRHVPSISYSRLNLPLSILKSKSNLATKNQELKKFYQTIITKQKFRYYSQSVFICIE